MKTTKEIKRQKREDRAFIISAVTAELYNLAYLKYFGVVDYSGGMGWLFSECIEITDKIMFTEGSAYLKWLDQWSTNDDITFYEVVGESFDWYHMDEARKEFKSRYEEDSVSEIKSQILEQIKCLTSNEVFSK